LQFSTDDEEFEEVQSDTEGVAITLDQGERLLKPKQGKPNAATQKLE
jgi:hypothetical protein